MHFKTTLLLETKVKKIKGSTHQEDITLIYALNNKVLKYMKQKLTELKRKIDNSTIIELSIPHFQ